MQAGGHYLWQQAVSVFKRETILLLLLLSSLSLLLLFLIVSARLKQVEVCRPAATILGNKRIVL